jgi:cell wall assembly regulator SMI1
MRWPVHLATGVVYLALLVVPVGGLLGYSGLLVEGDDIAAFDLEWEQARQTLTAEAAGLPLAELVAALVDGTPVAADIEHVEQAEARLGARLPDELRALYRLNDGLPELGLSPLAELAPATDAFADYLEAGVDVLGIEAGDDWHDVPIAAARGWWRLGDDTVYYDPAPQPAIAGVRVIDGLAGYASLQAWLQASYVSLRMGLWTAERHQRALLESRAALVEAGVDELLGAFEPPDLLSRWLLRVEPWPGPADPALIGDAERRLGRLFDADLRELWLRHDGFPPLGLLSPAEVAEWASLRARMPEELADALTMSVAEFAEAGESGRSFDPTALRACLVIGASRIGAYPDEAPDGRALFPQLLSCPPGAGLPAIVDLSQRVGHADFRSWLRDRAARVRAVGMGT